MTSSVPSGNFLFAPPKFYLNTPKFYHDTLYLGFTALDNSTNSECSREYNSGWWYPHALQYDYYSESKKEFCTHHPFNGTNLNGVLDVLNPNQTTRTIAFCQMNDVNDCIKPKYGKYKFASGNEHDIIDGWNYNNVTTYKLKSTRMWLGKKM